MAGEESVYNLISSKPPAPPQTDSSESKTLSADVYTHLSRLDLLGGISQHEFLSLDWSAKEALFTSLLDRLGRPTLRQYASERQNSQRKVGPEARIERKRWSEESFRGIFLKILLKDLKDLGFARVLSTDDLLSKRRACLLAVMHLLNCIDPSIEPPPPPVLKAASATTPTIQAEGTVKPAAGKRLARRPPASARAPPACNPKVTRAGRQHNNLGASAAPLGLGRRPTAGPGPVSPSSVGAKSHASATSSRRAGDGPHCGAEAAAAGGGGSRPRSCGPTRNNLSPLQPPQARAAGSAGSAASPQPAPRLDSGVDRGGYAHGGRVDAGGGGGGGAEGGGLWHDQPAARKRPGPLQARPAWNSSSGQGTEDDGGRDRTPSPTGNQRSAPPAVFGPAPRPTATAAAAGRRAARPRGGPAGVERADATEAEEAAASALVAQAEEDRDRAVRERDRAVKGREQAVKERDEALRELALLRELFEVPLPPNLHRQQAASASTASQGSPVPPSTTASTITATTTSPSPTSARLCPYSETRRRRPKGGKVRYVCTYVPYVKPYVPRS